MTLTLFGASSLLSRKPKEPMLLADEDQIEMTRDDFVEEIGLLLKMRTHVPFNQDTYLYSLRVLEPCPFRPPALFEEILRRVPPTTASNMRAGYLVHDDLYNLQDEAKLLGLVDLFLTESKAIEVKVRRAPENQRTVRVTLVEEARQ